MLKRTAKFVPALFAAVLAAANLTTGTDLRAQATQGSDDTCLSSPKGATSNGGHWYYRIDRATKRQCWYLRDEGEKSAQAPLDSPATPPAATADSAPQQPAPITNKAIADARAEWVSQQSRAERNSPAKADPQTTGAVSAPTVQNSKPAAAPNVLAPTPISTTRWSDPPGTGSSTPANANPQTAAADAPAADQTQDAAEQVQQPAGAPVAAVAADPAPAKPTASLQMLLLVMAAALALAGITVSLIFRVGRLRARRAMRLKRRAMWDSVQKKTKRRAPSPQPMIHDEDARLRRPGGVQHTRVPQERPRVPQERPRVVPQERTYAPQERARAPQERVRVPQERARAPQEWEQQVSEMLARLARSAHS
jgi:hypothetical protein